MRSILLYGILVVSAAAIPLSLAQAELRRAKQSFERAKLDLVECQKLAPSLKDDGPLPTNELQSARRLTEVVPYLQKSAEGAALPRDAIVFIEPGAMKQVSERSSVEELVVHVELEDLPLVKLGRFLRHIESTSKDFKVQELRLSAPRSRDSKENHWDCELALTCLVDRNIEAEPQRR